MLLIPPIRHFDLCLLSRLANSAYVLCKSPIDALSLAVLQIQDSGNTPAPRIMYLVADCPKSLRVEYLKNIPKVVTAYDNDDLGNETAIALQQLLLQATTHIPHFSLKYTSITNIGLMVVELRSPKA